MSVIACRVLEKSIEIAGDSAATYQYQLKTSLENSSSKLFKINNMIVGSVGECAENALFRLYCSTRQPKRADVDSIFSFYCEFLDFKKNKTEKYKGANHYIIVFNGKAFKIEGFGVTEIEKFFAIGCGMDIALAVMHLGHSVKEAVKIACELSPFCSEPIIYFKIKK